MSWSIILNFTLKAFRWILFTCGFLAARKWLPAEEREMLSEGLKWRVILDLKSS
jgi:hypothetical protein